MDNKKNMEEQLSQLLTEGEIAQKDPDKEAPKRLSPRYEIRIQTEHDPIAEETKRYRGMAKEIDDRYDKYMQPDSE